MLAVAYAAEHFHLYLYGSRFIITTYHQPLLGIVKSLKPTTSRTERWHLYLMPNRYSLIYQPSKDDLNPADYLSRHPRHKPKREYRCCKVCDSTRHTKVNHPRRGKQATEKDPLQQKVMAAISDGHGNKQLLSRFVQLKNGLHKMVSSFKANVL